MVPQNDTFYFPVAKCKTFMCYQGPDWNGVDRSMTTKNTFLESLTCQVDCLSSAQTDIETMAKMTSKDPR
ncbi:hypothetical protein BgiBS90_018607 [Biomphalaria glabrata]|nr:hypothetical protein BgiBS90_018607 [Biomphalaria glabrata]